MSHWRDSDALNRLSFGSALENSVKIFHDEPKQFCYASIHRRISNPDKLRSLGKRRDWVFFEGIKNCGHMPTIR
jgi:hypothetical protein